MNKILALVISAAAVSTVALASEPAKPANSQLNFSGGKWSIRVFYGFASGDIKDDGEVDGIYGAALEYALPNIGTGMTGNLHFGLEYNTSTEGIVGFTVQNYGLYAGYAFPLGQDMAMPLEAVIRAGYFNTKMEDDFAEDDEWGFGWDLGLRYRLSKMWIEAFYRQRPSVQGISNNAFAIGVNFPIGN